MVMQLLETAAESSLLFFGRFLTDTSLEIGEFLSLVILQESAGNPFFTNGKFMQNNQDSQDWKSNTCSTASAPPAPKGRTSMLLRRFFEMQYERMAFKKVLNPKKRMIKMIYICK